MLQFRTHALRRMARRKISVDDVRHVLDTGEVFYEYSDDQPFPSRLVIGWCGERPIHVLVADERERAVTIVIIAYERDPTLWEPDFRRRVQ